MDSIASALNVFFESPIHAGGLALYIVFVSASGMIGIACVLLNACIVFLWRNSSLGLTHGWHATPKAALVWAIGAMLGSGIGMLIGMFRPTPLAAVVAALTWRGLLRQWQRLASHRNDPGSGD